MAIVFFWRNSISLCPASFISTGAVSDSCAGTGVAERRYPTSKVRSGGHEDIPHVRGKRNPSKTVSAERGHQRADRLKPQSQKTSQSDHMDHSLV